MKAAAEGEERGGGGRHGLITPTNVSLVAVKIELMSISTMSAGGNRHLNYLSDGRDVMTLCAC